MDSLKYFGLLLNMYYNIHNTHIHACIYNQEEKVFSMAKKMEEKQQSSKKASSEVGKDA